MAIVKRLRVSDADAVQRRHVGGLLGDAADEIVRLRGAVIRARDLLRKIVATGYSRHEINCFLAADENGVDAFAEVGTKT